MPTHSRKIAVLVAAVTVASGLIHAQGRGGGAWTTSGGDAQRSGWVRTDPRISKEGIAKAPLQLLWKRQLEKPAGQRSVSQPVLLPNIISYKGFKALAFVGGANSVYSLDYDLNKMFWQRSLAASSAAGPAATAPCAAGPVAVSRATPLGAPAGGRGGFGGGRGAGNNVYAVSNSGMVHALNPQTGEDANPPAKFTGGAATIAGAVFIDNVVYGAAVETCGSVASGVYAVDLTENKNLVTSWDAKGARIAGALGPAFAADGTVFVATGASAGDATFANAIVALEAKTLKAKDWFTASTPFTSSPTVFTQDGQTRVAAANADGSLYVLDAAALGGSDHKTPLAKSTSTAKAGNFLAGALTTWEGEGSSRWIAVPARDGITAFRLPAGNTPVPEPVWTSNGVAAPGPPIVLNGVVFAVSNGEAIAGARVQRKPSVLHALDAATGKVLWNSGSAMSSFVPGVPLSAGDGQVYVVTADGVLYAFGVPLEH